MYALWDYLIRLYNQHDLMNRTHQWRQKNLHHLFAFVLLAREGSLNKAAAQLEVSQSVLSHSIKGLEASLGIRLLTHKLVVSPLQKLVRVYCKRFNLDLRGLNTSLVL